MRPRSTSAAGAGAVPSIARPGERVPLEQTAGSGIDRLHRPLRFVALGGGTGLPIVLRGLKQTLFPPGFEWREERDADRITAVVTVADDGGSSGRLREEYHVLPPGDVRNCLLALAQGDPTLEKIFTFRFNGRHELRNHSLGNLILIALCQLEHDFARATEMAGAILSIRGRVCPSTAEDVRLVAELSDGTRIYGESSICLTHRPIRRILLQPENAAAIPDVLRAIAAADVVVIGPGSLYTSLVPVLLVRQIARAIEASRAQVMLVMNLMTEPGETDGHTAIDFVNAIRRHAPEVPLHVVILNTAQLPPYIVQLYGAMGATPVPMDPAPLREAGCRIVERDLLEHGPVARHDPRKLCQAILEAVLEQPA